MNSLANITSTPALASIDAIAGLPRRLAPGIGLVIAGLMSVALWGGLAQIALAVMA